MSVLCCWPSRRSTLQDPDIETCKFLARPQPAKLSRTPYSPGEFEMPLFPTVTTRAPSLLSSPIPEAEVDPTVLDDGDSDTGLPAAESTKQSPSTLEAIRTKLVRHLSHKSQPRRHSQQSLGNSQEELARRAELRRLMHRRIQEELQNEEEEQAVKPVAPNIDNNKKSEASGVNPRDSLEFSVVETDRGESQDKQQGSKRALPLLFSAKGRQRQRIRRGSWPEWTSESHERLCPSHKSRLGERLSLPQMPPPLHLAPNRALSGRGPISTVSRHLSRVSRHLLNDLCLMKASRSDVTERRTSTGAEVHGNENLADDDATNVKIAITGATSTSGTLGANGTLRTGRHANDPTFAGHPDGNEETFTDADSDPDSPLDMWLRSQELHTASVVSYLPVCVDTVTPINISGTDSRATLNPMSATHDPAIASSEQASKSNSPTSENQEAPLTPKPGSQSNLIPAVREQASTPTPSSRSTKGRTDPAFAESPSNESVALQQAVAELGGAFGGLTPSRDRGQRAPSSHYTSSRYTSRPSSRRLTPKESGTSLNDMLTERKLTTPVSSFPTRVTPSRIQSIAKSNAGLRKMSELAVTPQNQELDRNQAPRRSTEDTVSSAVSETASFQQREAELQSIQERFRASKFFRESSDPTIHLTVPRKSKDLANQLQLRKNRSTETEPQQSLAGKKASLAPDYRRKHSSRSFSNECPPGIEETATGMWQRAIKQEAEQRDIHKRASSANTCSSSRAPASMQSLSKPRYAEETDYTKGSIDSWLDVPLSPTMTLRPRQVVPSFTIEPPSERSGTTDPESKGWADQSDVSGGNTIPVSRARSISLRPVRLQTPPASWAKWPSHNRHERTGAAGQIDNVIARDFATSAESSDRTDTEHASKEQPTPITRSLPIHFSRAIKGGWDRLIPSRSRRDSCHLERGYLEYPELELLPTLSGYKELQALEQQIETMKRQSTSGARRSHASTSESSKPRMAGRVVEEVHKMQHGEASASCYEADEARPDLPMSLLVTPPPAPPGSRTVSVASGFATPKSHLSYDDCVPTHMLDEDNGSIRSRPSFGGLEQAQHTRDIIKQTSSDSSIPETACFEDAQGEADSQPERTTQPQRLNHEE
ncbi:hypothetical protein GGR56DRAFT_24127 [Xylariaceae sp. FL0804]|nr:hypothetical protein GGR56DRAFT_24127 [Xylariaceae sp. FL0804]